MKTPTKARPFDVCALLVAAPVVLVFGCGSSDAATHAAAGADAAPDVTTRTADGSIRVDGGRPRDVTDAGTSQRDARVVTRPTDAATAPDGAARVRGETGARVTERCDSGVSDAAPPTLISARLVAEDSVEVAFSEPVQLSAPANLAEFRLSYAMRTNAEGLLITVYQPLGAVMGPDGGPPEFPFVSLTVGGACGTTISLHLERPLARAEVCAALDRLSVGADPGTTGLYLHVGEATYLEDHAHHAVVPVVPEFLPREDGGPLPDKFVVHEYDPAPPLAAMRVDVGCEDAPN